jgi:dimethylargininase
LRALVRRPGPRLGEGIVTHVPRSAVDVELACEQWAAYVRALEGAGWETVEVAPADDCPDCVFVEDTVVVTREVAVVTRPGAPSRIAETGGVARVLEDLGYEVARIRAPGTLDGGDVLRLGDLAYVGVGRRTNAEGAKQLQALTGLRVVPVPVPAGALHLKTALTFLPDGTRIDGNVLPLDSRRVLVSAASAGAVARRGYQPVTVDISELEKLEAGLTCLSVLLPR